MVESVSQSDYYRLGAVDKLKADCVPVAEPKPLEAA